MKRVFCLLILIAPACKQPEPAKDYSRAKQLVNQYGCTSCHQVPGVGGVKGMGPTLSPATMKIAPPNVARYIQNPQEVDRDATMPNLGVPIADANEIAAYIASLK